MSVTEAQICKPVIHKYAVLSFNETRFCPDSAWLFRLELWRKGDDDLGARLTDWTADFEMVIRHYSTLHLSNHRPLRDFY